MMRLRFAPPVSGLLLSWIVAAADMPLLDSTVFEGGIEERSGLIFFPLHSELTLAYDKAAGSLALAWKGRALRQPDPHPASGTLYRVAGPIRHRLAARKPWSARGPSGPVPVTVEFVDVYRPEGEVTFQYRLLLPKGRKVSVEETPGYDDHYGHPALRRNFTLTGIPAGYSVILVLSGEGDRESWAGGGAGRLEKSPRGIWTMVQSQDGETPLKVTWPEPKSGDYPSNSPVSVP